MEIPVSDRNSAQVHHVEPPAGEPPMGSNRSSRQQIQSDKGIFKTHLILFSVCIARSFHLCKSRTPFLCDTAPGQISLAFCLKLLLSMFYFSFMSFANEARGNLFFVFQRMTKGVDAKTSLGVGGQNLRSTSQRKNKGVAYK